MYTEKQRDRFISLFVKDQPPLGGSLFLDIERRIAQLPSSDPDLPAFREILADDIVNASSMGGMRYRNDDREPILTEIDAGILERLVDRGFEEADFFSAFLAFFKHQHKRCLDRLSAFIRQTCTESEPMDEVWFNSICVVPFKNAFPMFYLKIKALLETLPCESNVLDLCEALDAYYRTEDYDEQADTMASVLQKHPDSFITTTFLGFSQYFAKRWGPAIACFERLEETGASCMYDADVYFSKAWAYSKLREHENAIAAYAKSLEIDPETPFARNNMGYEYYLLRQYAKALETFQACIDSKVDLRFAANNYLRTLLAMKRYADAKTFALNPPAKLLPVLVRKVEAAENRNLDVPRDTVDQTAESIPAEEDAEFEAEFEQGQEQESQKFPVSADARRQQLKNGQFSTEKLLEDELTRRLEAGTLTFGQPLKIYRRHGEYGRQYIIPIGRLDLLAEDEDGNLYIIELKKDSGYDDAYAQIVQYIEWFEEYKKPKGKTIQGILCVNNPPKRLIDAVRKDNRVRLFHYQISYEEIR